MSQLKLLPMKGHDVGLTRINTALPSMPGGATTKDKQHTRTPTQPTGPVNVLWMMLIPKNRNQNQSVEGAPWGAHCIYAFGDPMPS